MWKTYVLFAVLGIVWGSNFIYTKLAAAHLSAVQIVFLRVLLGFLPVAAYALARKKLRWTHARHWPHFLIMSLLATTVYYYGYAAGTARLPSGVAGALSATIPLFAFALALLFIPAERLTARRLAGLAAGSAGVALLARPFSADALAHTHWDGVAFMTLGSASIGASFVYAKKFVTPLGIAPLALVTYQLGLATILLALTTPYAGMADILQDAHAALGLIIGLGVLGTGLAYILYYHIVATLGAVAASSSTYLPALVALFIGAVFAGESIGWVEIGGTALIIAGVLLINKKRKH